MTAKLPSPRDTGPEGLRALLIDAALEILEDPNTPLDLRKVAETAGKSRTAPYLVFGKESEGGGLLALRLAVAAEGVRMVAERMVQAEASTDDPLLAFRGVAAAFLSFAVEHPRLFRLMYGPEIGVVSSLSVEGLRAHAEFGDLLHHRMAAERALNRAIEGCQAHRLLPQGEPMRYTLIAWASLIGVAFLLLDEILEAAGFEADPEEAAALVVQSVTGLDTGALEGAARSFLLAQLKSETGPEPPAVPPPAAEALPPDVNLVLRAPTLDAAWMADRPPELSAPRYAAAPPDDTFEPAPPARAVYEYSGLRRAALSRAALEGARVLWVDDRPELVDAERATLEGLGMEVETAPTTADAEACLRAGPFDLIVSDIARPGDAEAGLRGLATLRAAAPRAPVIFYVARLDRPRGVPEGAAGITNSMDELLHLVLDALERRR